MCDVVAAATGARANVGPLPISQPRRFTHTLAGAMKRPTFARVRHRGDGDWREGRSEEHTSELQSQFQLVCRLLLEKKKFAQVRHSGDDDWREGRSGQATPVTQVQSPL